MLIASRTSLKPKVMRTEKDGIFVQDDLTQEKERTINTAVK